MLLRVPRMLFMVAIMQLIFIRMLMLAFSYSYFRALRIVRPSAFTRLKLGVATTSSFLTYVPDRHEKLECVRSAVHAIYRTWELFGISMGSCGADDFMPVFTYALP